QVQALLLRTVAQRGVVDVEGAGHGGLSGVSGTFPATKHLPVTRGWRDGGSVALGDENGLVEHRSSVPQQSHPLVWPFRHPGAPSWSSSSRPRGRLGAWTPRDWYSAAAA